MLIKPIQEPLQTFFDADKTQCLCWHGVPTHPDNTVIPGLGSIEPSLDQFDSNYDAVAIGEPSLGIPVLCFGLILLGMVRQR